jgi:hypothetical protein
MGCVAYGRINIRILNSLAGRAVIVDDQKLAHRWVSSLEIGGCVFVPAAFSDNI